VADSPSLELNRRRERWSLPAESFPTNSAETNEIYTGWRWPRVVHKFEHRPLDYAKIWRMAQNKTARPVRFDTCCSQVIGLFLDLYTPKYKEI
jgi:hypothetical protein